MVQYGVAWCAIVLVLFRTIFVQLNCFALQHRQYRHCKYHSFDSTPFKILVRQQLEHIEYLEGKIADTEVDLESSTLELSESKNQITNSNNMYQNSVIENKILLGNEVKKRIEMESTLNELKMQLIQSKNEKELLSVKHTKDENEKITDLLKTQEKKYFVLLDSILEVIGRYQRETTLPSHILFFC